jgi:hypothetical protein
MSLGHKYRRILSALLPTGMVGVSMLLASAAPAAVPQADDSANQSAKSSAPGSNSSMSGPVNERLAAIREAVSAMSVSPPRRGENLGANLGEGRELAWGNWGNIPLPLPWNNWRNGWNNWNNAWNNWRNWPNWHNWNNYWRNW